jgi:hypothetical protein
MANLIQIQEQLKGMPIQALMSYAQGANPDVPPYVALSELSRRKSMMQSGQAQGQGQAQQGPQPTIKDQIVQQTGLMSALQQRQQGMQQMLGQQRPQQPQGMAAGGVVALAAGGPTPFGAWRAGPGEQEDVYQQEIRQAEAAQQDALARNDTAAAAAAAREAARLRRILAVGVNNVRTTEPSSPGARLQSTPAEMDVHAVLQAELAGARARVASAPDPASKQRAEADVAAVTQELSRTQRGKRPDAPAADTAGIDALLGNMQDPARTAAGQLSGQLPSRSVNPFDKLRQFMQPGGADLYRTSAGAGAGRGVVNPAVVTPGAEQPPAPEAPQTAVADTRQRGGQGEVAGGPSAAAPSPELAMPPELKTYLGDTKGPQSVDEYMQAVARYKPQGREAAAHKDAVAQMLQARQQSESGRGLADLARILSAGGRGGLASVGREYATLDSERRKEAGDFQTKLASIQVLAAKAQDAQEAGQYALAAEYAAKAQEMQNSAVKNRATLAKDFAVSAGQQATQRYGYDTARDRSALSAQGAEAKAQDPVMRQKLLNDALKNDARIADASKRAQEALLPAEKKAARQELEALLRAYHESYGVPFVSPVQSGGPASTLDLSKWGSPSVKAAPQ